MSMSLIQTAQLRPVRRFPQLARIVSVFMMTIDVFKEAQEMARVAEKRIRLPIGERTTKLK